MQYLLCMEILSLDRCTRITPISANPLALPSGLDVAIMV